MKTVPTQIIDAAPNFKKTLAGFQNGLKRLGESDSTKQMFVRLLRVGDTTQYFLAIGPLDEEGNFDMNEAINMELPCPPFCKQQLHIEDVV